MNLRQRLLAISRIKAGLHARFWLPIAEMLDPYHRMASADGAAQDFYSRGLRALSSDEMEESLALMKSYHGTPELTFNIWFKLRPIYQNLLGQALTKADMDLVACAVREFVRLALGQPADDEYVPLDSSNIDEGGPDFAYWSNGDWKVFFATTASQKLFDDADEFVRRFPRSADHRLNMVLALRPIFDRAWITNWPVTEQTMPYVEALLAINFRETGLVARPADRSGLLEASQPPTATDVRLPSLADA